MNPSTRSPRPGAGPDGDEPDGDEPERDEPERNGPCPRAEREPAVTAVLSWRDPLTGELLTTEMTGSRAFLSDLRRLGFRVLSEDDPSAPLGGRGTGTEAWPDAGVDGDRPCVGPVSDGPGHDPSGERRWSQSFRAWRRAR